MVHIADGRFELPDSLSYSQQHVYLDKDKKLVGLDEIGYAFLKNPTELKILVEKEVEIDEPMATILTERGITTLNSPCRGVIKSINEKALNNMENDAYSSGFLVEFESISEASSELVSGREKIEKWGAHEVKSLLHGYYAFKVIEIGDSATGKTAIKVRLTDDYFKKDLKTTLGVDFGAKELKCEYIDNSDVLFSGSYRFTVKMNVWDAAGQSHYEKIRGMYYRGAKGALLVYDVNNPISFENLNSWIKELEENIGQRIPVLMVGNKIDLERNVKSEAAKEYAKKNSFLYAECSAKTGEGVVAAFKKLAIEIYKKEEDL